MNSYDEKSSQYYLLKKFKFLLSYNFYNIPKREAKYNHRLDKTLNYIDILNLILNTSEELKTAYFLKENYVEFNGKSTLENAEANLNVLLDNILSKNIPEFNKVYSMLKHWKVEIVNSFNLSKDGRRINNSVIEGRNSTIKKIIRNANGVKNFQRIRNRIMYCLNNEAFSIEENKENNIKQKGNKRGKYNKNN